MKVGEAKMTVNEGLSAGLSSTKHANDLGFDLNDLKSGVGHRFLGWILNDPRWLFKLLRCLPKAGFPPWFTLSGWVIVTRFDDVQEVLTHDQVFRVPYGEKTRKLNGGPNFLLGMEDGECYRRYQKLVMRAFRLEDAQCVVSPMAARLSRELLEASRGRIDAIEDLLTRVAVLICKEYYGLPISDPTVFGLWTIATSTHIFVDAAKVVPAHRRAAEAAAERIRALVDGAIAQARKTPRSSDTVLSRLVDMQATERGLTDEMIRAFLIGMVMGFVPTNTLAGGNILAVLLRRRSFLAWLLRRRSFMSHAQAAALSGDDDLLQRCLFEALRFKHIHWGLTRICQQNYTIAEGTLRRKLVRRGAKVLASTWSAMFDPRRIKNPSVFDPFRPPTDYMLLGYGLHWCIGAYIAYAQITQTFKQLLVQQDLKRAQGKKGRLQLLGNFPQHLCMKFTAPAAGAEKPPACLGGPS